jgi:hypothetical protein
MKYRICYQPCNGYFAQIRHFLLWESLLNAYENVIYFKTADEAEAYAVDFKQKQESEAYTNKISIIRYGRI